MGLGVTPRNVARGLRVRSRRVVDLVQLHVPGSIVAQDTDVELVAVATAELDLLLLKDLRHGDMLLIVNNDISPRRRFKMTQSCRHQIGVIVALVRHGSPLSYINRTRREHLSHAPDAIRLRHG